jgi:DNA-binding SARP family transcriptional activator
MGLEPAVPAGSDTNEGPPTSLGAAVDLLHSIELHMRSARALVRELSTQLHDQPTDPADRSAAPTDAGSAAGGPARLRLRCLGPFEAYWGDEPILRRPAGKGRTILKYLAARPRQPVLRDVLLEVLWPEADPQVANNRLRVAMHHLRQACSTSARRGLGECVVFRDGCYAFNGRLEVWTDVEAFEAAWQAGARLERAGRIAEAVLCYDQAESLYRGDYLEEDPFEEWTLLRREELRGIYLTILGKLSDHWLRSGDLERAMAGWNTILARDPCREDAYRQLMLCSARVGQRSAALRWYDLCAQVLREQLRLAPEPETAELYRRIRAGEEVGARPDGQAHRPPAAS